MTNTRPATISWDHREFAAIAAIPVPSPDRPTYHCVGHDREDCPVLLGTIVARGTSLAEHAASSEWWDGEAEYLTPWPCPTCVRVDSHPATVGFEAEPRERFGSGSGSGTSRPAVEVPDRLDEAIAFARSYSGSFGFMVAMREKAQRRSWTPTPNMLAAILRCLDAEAAKAPRKARESHEDGPEAQGAATPAPSAEDARRAGLAANRYAGQCDSCRGEVAAEAGVRERLASGWVVLHRTTAECAATPAPAEAAPAHPTVTPKVPEGHYAIPSTGSNDLAFYRVDRPEDGPWAGRVFVKLVVGGHPDQRVPRTHVAGILLRIADYGPEAAAALYGRELGRCGRCNRHLTDAESRAHGIGPDCRAKAW